MPTGTPAYPRCPKCRKSANEVARFDDTNLLHRKGFDLALTGRSAMRKSHRGTTRRTPEVTCGDCGHTWYSSHAHHRADLRRLSANEH